MRYKYILAYLRLSNDDDDKTDESNSIKNQRLLIEHFVKNSEEFQGAEIVSFADDGFSGTNFERPEFKRMIALANRKGAVLLYHCKRLVQIWKGYHNGTELY